MVDLWASGRGFLEETDDPTRRIAKPILYARDETDTISFGYGRPIEGLTPVIDLNNKCIIAIEDLGVKPLAPKASQLKKIEKEADPKLFPPLRSLDIIQKEGPSFTVDDHHIRWQGWDLKVGFNAREGLTIHTAQIFDREQQKFRQVLYRASCAEMVVPYGDPRYLDACTAFLTLETRLIDVTHSM
jgi:primary-amine oxidase